MTDRDDRDEAAAREREMQRIDTLEAEIERATADRERARVERDRLASELDAERRRQPTPAALTLRPMSSFEIDRLVADLRTAAAWTNPGARMSYPLVSVALMAIVWHFVGNGLVLFAIAAASLIGVVQLTRVRSRRWQPILDIVRNAPERLHSLNYTSTNELTIRYDAEVVVLQGSGLETIYHRLERRRLEATKPALPGGTSR